MKDADLLAYLMKVDRELFMRKRELEDLLNCQDVEFYSKEFWSDEEADNKMIDEIVFDFAGIPEKNHDKNYDSEKEDYNRDKVRDIYHHVVYYNESDISLEQFADILIETANKRGSVSDEVLKRLDYSL